MESIYKHLPLRDQCATLRRQVVAQSLHVFSGWGYREIEVPLIDDFDVLKRGLSSEQVEQSLRFVDRLGNVMMLRSDSTPAVAKALSFQVGPSSATQRVCYSNKVVRIERGRSKSQLESYQIGVELIGISGIAAEIELVCICCELLKHLNLTNFQFNFTDHALVNRLLNLTGAPLRIRNEVKDAIKARDKYYATEILSKLGVREKYIVAIEALAHLEGGFAPLETIEDLFGDDDQLLFYVRRLRQLYSHLSDLGFSDYVRIDLAELRAPHYYDGIAFNIVSEGVGRSIGGGGRYNELFGSFGKRTPAAGFGLETDLLCELIYPKVGFSNPYASTSETVAIASDNLVEGFKRVLYRRSAQEQTRILLVDNSSDKR